MKSKGNSPLTSLLTTLQAVIELHLTIQRSVSLGIIDTVLATICFGSNGNRLTDAKHLSFYHRHHIVTQ